LDESKQKGKAIMVYMEAAELYLKAIQEMSSKENKTEVSDVLKGRLKQILDRVEELKNSKTGMQQKTINEQPLSVQQKKHHRDSLTKEEIEVLKRSSQMTSGLFLPWNDQDADKLAIEASNPSTPLFTDPAGYLALSSKQRERFHRWARPSEILRLRQQNAILGSVLRPKPGTPEIVKTITPYTIKQKYVTDCSFIASLCICAAYERRFHKRLVTNTLYPQNKNGELMYNPSGKYMVKLWLNGVARCVIIDDYLPIDKKGNLLCSHTANNSDSTLELWVSLIEKAYMKLCGGYNFPGSNSGVDLFSLTGWIPERVHFAKDANNVKDHETPPERAWERIFSASSYGDCLITVSTQSDLPEKEADEVGIVTGHAYAVLAVVQTKNGTRLLQLKNPWAHKGWRGPYSCLDRESWKCQAFREEVGYNPDLAAKQDDGVFWISWYDILRYFSNFHLSWNPVLFRSRLTVHGCWPKEQGPSDDTFNIGENPQYTMTLSDQAIQKKATIWILISRHVTKQEQAGAEVRWASSDFTQF
jgi:calpain-7